MAGTLFGRCILSAGTGRELMRFYSDRLLETWQGGPLRKCGSPQIGEGIQQGKSQQQCQRICLSRLKIQLVSVDCLPLLAQFQRPLPIKLKRPLICKIEANFIFKAEF